MTFTSPDKESIENRLLGVAKEYVKSAFVPESVSSASAVKMIVPIITFSGINVRLDPWTNIG